jgi:hypothetical protein
MSALKYLRPEKAETPWFALGPWLLPCNSFALDHHRIQEHATAAQKKRRAAFLSESAVGEANPIGFNELRGSRHVSVCHASFVPFCARKRQVGDPPGAVLGGAAPSQGPIV